MRRFLTLRRRGASKKRALAVECRGICALTACGVGSHATVLQVRCAGADACRLRSLGVFEGARVSIVDGRNGLLLNVRGSRLALDWRTAASILVMPAGAA